MNVFSVENLSKSYGDKVLFNDIAFSVAENEKIALIGVNGTGKSTLLKVIAGIDSADQGEISHPNEYRIEYLSQAPDFDYETTVLEQIFYGDSPMMKLFIEYEIALKELQLAPNDEQKQNKLLTLQQKMDTLDAWDANTNAKTILTKLGITDYNKKIGQLSGGQKKRVALARAFIQPADLLILDEPTNHIDNETVEWLEEYLVNYKGAILLVTHDRYFLNRVTNKILELENGKIFNYEGNYEYFLEKKAEREAKDLASELKRQNILRRELEWLKRGAKARTTKQKARIDRAEELQNNKADLSKDQINISIKSSRLGKKIIELDNISKSFDTHTLIKDFSLIVLPDERIGIIGPNGAGKSTLLQLISGKLKPDHGIVEIGQTVKIAYYTQENVDLDEEMRVIEYIKDKAEVIHTSDGKDLTASQMLERFLFHSEMQWTLIRKLSGGERRRLYLLGILMSAPNVLLLDEPTNDLDIQTLSILEDYIFQFNGVVITVSHDRYFLDRTVDHIISFEGNGELNQYFGNYTDYLEKKKQERNIKETIKKDKKVVSTTKGLKLKLSYNEQKEWDEIEEVISSLEERLKEIQEAIGHAGSDFEQVEILYRDEKEISKELETKVERWTELSELIEEIERNKTQSN